MTLPEALTFPEALALIEFGSIAVGTRAVDALLKKAPVRVERVGTLQPGKLAVMFSGDVANVEASHAAALAVGAAAVDDEVLLWQVDGSVYQAAMGQIVGWQGDTLAVIEADTLAAVIEAADVAIKGASVRIVSIRLGDELGGKGLLHLVGEQHDVEAAVALVAERAARPGRRLQSSITARLDEDLRGWLTRSTRFWGGN